MHKSLFLSSLVWLTATTSVFAGGVVLYSVLPNTTDDTNLEYIEISNTSCASINLAGYVLKDAAGTSYTLVSEALAVGAIKRFSRPDTRIALNNTDETIYLIDPTGVVIDSERYTTSVKGVPITFVVSPDLNCNISTTTQETTTTTTTITEVNSTGSTDPVTQSGTLMNTGSLLSASGGVTSTGAVTGSGAFTGTGSDLGSGLIGSGTSITLTGSIILLGSGSISTGSGIITSSGSTTSSGAILSLTGSTLNSTNSGSIISGTGTIVGSGTNFSGSSSAIIPIINTGSLLAPIPLLLKILDLNNNGHIDKLIVEYSNTLTGSLRLDKFIIYSATGGLATRRIETGSGVVRALSYSGSELWIDLFEQDLARIDLRINTTTESHLRLKTLADFGLTSLGGTPAEPITLTESFGRYKSDFILNLALPTIVPVVLPSHSVNMQVSDPVPISSVTSIPIVIPPPSETTVLPIPMPTPLPPISISVQSGILSNGACRTSACGVNLKAIGTVSGDICTWQIQPTKGRTTIIESCNPRTFSLGSGGGVVSLSVLRSGGVREDRTLSISAYSKPVKSNRIVDNTLANELLTTSISAENLAFSMNEDEHKISGADPVTINSSKKNPKKTVKKPSIKKAPAKKKAESKSVTSTTKKTTKTIKNPPPPKSIEKPQKNGLSTPSDPNTSIAIGVVGLICSALGFGVAIYRRPKASTLP